MIIDTHIYVKNESIEQLKETNFIQMTLNQEIEELWEQGKISFESFNWWLQWICGI